MSKNVAQIFGANPITTISDGDLIYVAQSGTADAAISATSLLAQLATSGASPTQVQKNSFNVGIDSGVADAYVVTLSPAIASYTDGLTVIFTPLNNNSTTSPTIAVNGLAAKFISTISGSGIVAINDIDSTSVCVLMYSVALGTFVLLNPATILNITNISNNLYNTANDSGGATNIYAGNPSTIPNDGTVGQNIGQFFFLSAIQNTNTGDSTFAWAGNTAGQIVKNDGTSVLTGGEIVAGATALFTLIGGGKWQLINPAA